MQFVMLRLRGTLVIVTSLLAVLVALVATPNLGPSAAAHPAPGNPGAETVVHAASCEQAPPQSVKDRATYTPAELDRYGLPQRAPSEPFEKWAKIVRNQRVRHCDYSLSPEQNRATGQYPLFWAGYVADQSTPSQSYSEIDLDYYVPCVLAPYDTSSDESQWIGLGGGPMTPGGDHGPGALLQTGSEVRWSGSTPTYCMWWEDYLDGASNTKRTLFQVGCGSAAHMYLKVWNGTCIYVQRLNDGYAQGNGCAARTTDNTTAEVIVERFLTLPPLANFNLVTFYGVGITDNGQYRPMGTDSLYGRPGVPHNKLDMRSCVPDYNGDCQAIGTLLASTGNILDNPGDTPYDQFTIYWWNAGP